MKLACTVWQYRKTIIPYYSSVRGHFSLAGGTLYEETHVLEKYRTFNITQVECWLVGDLTSNREWKQDNNAICLYLPIYNT